jgi:hypothetical protein
MPYSRLFFLQAAVIATIGATHLAALQWYLYWHLPWLDVPVHFLGGMWIALAAAFIFVRITNVIRADAVFASVAFLGIAWEVFEMWAGIPREANFIFDTSLDLCMDALGGICGFVIARHLTKP